MLSPHLSWPVSGSCASGSGVCGVFADREFKQTALYYFKVCCAAPKNPKAGSPNPNINFHNLITRVLSFLLDGLF
jgi:hypothetical protein